MATRADIAETQLQRRLAELVFVAHETEFWDPSPRVLPALEGADRTA